jgi:hypothetical protein
MADPLGGTRSCRQTHSAFALFGKNWLLPGWPVAERSGGVRGAACEAKPDRTHGISGQRPDDPGCSSTVRAKPNETRLPCAQVDPCSPHLVSLPLHNGRCCRSPTHPLSERGGLRHFSLVSTSACRRPTCRPARSIRLPRHNTRGETRHSPALTRPPLQRPRNTPRGKHVPPGLPPAG